MKKYYLCAGFIFAFKLGSLAQSNAVSGGGTASGGGGSATYSLGQIDYSNSASATGSIQQGVQQPYEFFEEAGLFDIATIDFDVYPNPTSNQVVLTIDSDNTDLSFVLFDAQGKLIQQNEIDDIKTIIDMQNLSVGVYHLQLNQNEKTVQSFKIIKN